MLENINELTSKTDRFFLSFLNWIFNLLFSDIHSLDDLVLWMQRKLIPFTLIAGVTVLTCIILFRVIRARKASGNKRKPKMKSLKKTRKIEKAKGIFLGKVRRHYIYSPVEMEEHCLLFGKTGIGKTSAFIIQTLRRWVSIGTAFVFDITGKIHKRVKDPNKIVYEPQNPGSNVRYNIFGPIDRLRTADEKKQALCQLAEMIIPVNDNASGNSAYYSRFGREILKTALVAFYFKGKDFIDICKMIRYNSYPDLYSMLADTGNTYARTAIASFTSVKDDFNAAAKQVVDMALDIYTSDPFLSRSIGRATKDTIGIEPCMLESHSIYISTNDSTHEYFKSFFNLICAQYMAYFSGRDVKRFKTHPILFCLDELSSFGHLDILPALRKYRKHRIRIIAATQSLADLELNYGRAERTAIVDNFGLVVILGATDPDTQEYCAKLIGTETVMRKNVTVGSSNTTTEVETKDWVIEPNDLAYLGDDCILIYPEGCMRVKKVPYFISNPDEASEEDT